MRLMGKNIKSIPGNDGLTYWQRQYRANPFERDYLRFRSVRRHISLKGIIKEHQKRQVIFDKFNKFMERLIIERKGVKK